MRNKDSDIFDFSEIIGEKRSIRCDKWEELPQNRLLSVTIYDLHTDADLLALTWHQEEIIVASHAVTLDANLVATFTWDASTEPIVATSATYIIRIADANKDISYYSYEWNVDCEAPLYTGISITGGVDVPASGVVYLNPYRHTDFEINFNAFTFSNPVKLT